VGSRLSTPGPQERRFAAYIDGLAAAAGHEDRRAPLKEYCKGLLLPGERKSIEPMAARLNPGNVQATRQSLHHLVAKAHWSDQALLDHVREQVLPALQKQGPVVAWIVDDTGFPKKGKHSAGVNRSGAIDGRPTSEYSLPNCGDISCSTFHEKAGPCQAQILKTCLRSAPPRAWPSSPLSLHIRYPSHRTARSSQGRAAFARRSEPLTARTVRIPSSCREGGRGLKFARGEKPSSISPLSPGFHSHSRWAASLWPGASWGPGSKGCCHLVIDLDP